MNKISKSNTNSLIIMMEVSDRVVQKYTAAASEAHSFRARLFRELASICEHRDPDGKHCRHPKLCEQAKVLDMTIYQNGCFRQICPLLKK